MPRPLLFLTRVDDAVGDQEVLGEEVLGKVVELDVVGPEVVGCGYAADAGELVHILFVV